MFHFLGLFFWLSSCILVSSEGRILNSGNNFLINHNSSSIPPAPRPIVLWHGMGDCCCNPLSLGSIVKLLKENIPGVYVISIMIGKDVVEDTQNSFFMNVNDQVKIVCDQLANDSELRDGYNAIGFSQGAQFLRAVAQRCPSPRMLNFISLGGQHQGVYGLPFCLYPNHKICDYVRKIIHYAAYESWVQKSLVQAEYWHDPRIEDTYRRKSIFLADINNEQVVNVNYRLNLLNLTNMVLVKFEKDTMVEPKESSWFEYYTPGQSDEITPLNKSRIYVEDRLGLQQLNKSGRLHFLSAPGNHLQFTTEWFKSAIIDKYLT